jgi:hypothetical protein
MYYLAILVRLFLDLGCLELALEAPNSLATVLYYLDQGGLLSNLRFCCC